MNVAFFGDSICNGQGLAIHKGWVTRISASLCALANQFQTEILVINSSVNGRTSRQALETMPYEIQRSKIDVLIIQYGMNDCNVWESDRSHPRVSPLAFEANLKEMIDRGRTFGCKAIFLNTNHPTGRDTTCFPHLPVTYEQQNRAYNHIIRTVAASDSNLLFNDIERVFQQSTNGDRERLSRLLLPDLLHLSEDGHDLYYNFVYPRLATCVKQLLGPRKIAA